MQYAFVIDNRVCIGCHACTVACKAEHLVPIGVNRTWVKYVERGEYPNVSRNFQVTRCNHCRDAPCVKICPTTALFTRDDGIVDFDNRRCIGCKSCTQACPYDAIYIDPNTDTAAKCNFCAHRIDQGLNPSCVNVCPEQAIRFGDLSDPTSDVSKLVSREHVTVRKPDKHTFPSLYYIDGDQAALEPAATASYEHSIWSDQVRGVGHNQGVPITQVDLLGMVRKARATAELCEPEQPTAPLDGLLRELQGATGGEKVRRAYDQPDKGIMWGWEVAGYVFTKAIAAGLVFMVTLCFVLEHMGMGGEVASSVLNAQGAMLIAALVFLGLTGALLVMDLDQPKRFLYVLLRPQWKSWLVRGAYIITVFGALATAWLIDTWTIEGETIQRAVAWPLLVLSLLTAGYTGMLFGQCRGRDFWLSPLLLVHMVLHAPLAGLAVLALTGVAVGPWLLLALCLNALIIVAEVFGPHDSKDARATARDLRSGRTGRYLKLGVLAGGHVLPAALLALGGTFAGVVAGLLVLAAMLLSEYLWVYTPQRRPNT